MTLSERLRRALGVDGPASPSRWVVLDVEASGLDARRDRLIAIAAVALRVARGVPQIAFGDSFETVLRQTEQAPDKANILLHGIGVGAQRKGEAPRSALESFACWLGDAPLVAFHAAFDETLLQRSMLAALGHRISNPWVDLEPVAAALHPAVKARSLDDWLAHFHIECMARHEAAADALATAELLQTLWPVLRAQLPTPTFFAVQHLAAQGRWLQR